MTGPVTGPVTVVLAAVLFGVSTPAAARLAGDLGPFRLAGLLYLGAAAATIVPARRHWPPAAMRRAVQARLGAVVVLGGAVAPVLLAAGLTRVPAATASLLLNLELVLTVGIAVVLLGEPLGRAAAVGTVLVSAGGLAVAWSGPTDVRLGAAFVAAAAACWAVDNALTATLGALSPSQITVAKGAVAGTANLVLGVAVDGVPDLGAALAAVGIGAVGYGASIPLWVRGARALGAARAQLIFAAAPFFGAAAAWAVLGEAVTTRQVVAAVVVAVGIAAVVGTRHDHDHDHPGDHPGGGGPVRHRHTHLADADHRHHGRRAGRAQPGTGQAS